MSQKYSILDRLRDDSKFSDIIKDDNDYSFLVDNKHLNKNICIIGLGGSYAYGTNVETSDLDIRGVATRTREDIYTGADFEQIVNVKTDTTIYSFDKIVKLLYKCNPNVIEMLGLKPEHYLYMSNLGQMLYRNRDIFLSKLAINSFGGYANAQLRRLNNKAARTVSQEQQMQHIKKTLDIAMIDIKNKFSQLPNDAKISLYVDKSEREDMDTELFCNIDLKGYPLKDYYGIVQSIGEIVKSYNKLGARNSKAIAANKLGKHMMHLIRLYLMCFDICENGEIITYREKEHDFLMDVRNGKYLDSNNQPTKEFNDIVDEYDIRLSRLKSISYLPDEPDMEKIHQLLYNVNDYICLHADEYVNFNCTSGIK